MRGVLKVESGFEYEIPADFDGAVHLNNAFWGVWEGGSLLKGFHGGIVEIANAGIVQNLHFDKLSLAVQRDHQASDFVVC